MSTKSISSYYWMYSVIFTNKYSKSTQNIFNNRKFFTYMAFTIHTQFSSSTACNYYYILIRTSFY